jgi:hypothetical protein
LILIGRTSVACVHHIPLDRVGFRVGHPYWFEVPFRFHRWSGIRPPRNHPRGSSMSADDEHVAHPRLYGAPAFARPPSSITPTERPLDPDDLPLAVEQTPEERAVAEQLLAAPYGVADRPPAPEPGQRLRPQPLILGLLADRILRRAS